MNNFQRNAYWLKKCGKVVGDAEHISVAIGVDAEEIAEWFDCVRVSDDDWDEVRRRIVRDLHSLGNALKSGKIIAHVPVHLREKALDALCDRDVTGNGVAYLANMDKESADIAVLDSNDSKLNADGTAVILEGGKIGKAPGYKPPDLKPFV